MEQSQLDHMGQAAQQTVVGRDRSAAVYGMGFYDHLKPLARELKVAHPAMLKAIAASKKKNDKVDARKIADRLHCDLLPECYMAPSALRWRSGARLRRSSSSKKGSANRNASVKCWSASSSWSSSPAERRADAWASHSHTRATP
jgi:hypothetical protein